MEADKMIRLLTTIDAVAADYFCGYLVLSGEKLIPYYLNVAKANGDGKKRVYILWVENHYLACFFDEAGRSYFVDSFARKPADYGRRVEKFAGQPFWRLHKPIQKKNEVVCGWWILFFVFKFVRCTDFNSEITVPADLVAWWNESGYSRFLTIPNK